MNLPDITFAEADPNEMHINIKSTVESMIGRTLQESDPLTLFLRGIELIIIQQRLLIDQSAKMNLLTYAVGDYLDHLGELVGVTRLVSTFAAVTMQLNLSTERLTSTIIPKGTRFTADGSIFFALDEDCIIPAGEISVESKATCTVKGEVGNSYQIGEIAAIVDPQPFLKSAVNITISDGGSNTEEDESLRERIRLAPEKFSNAGSRGAYIFHAKSASTKIIDVCVESPSPGVVNVYPLCTDGSLPTQEILDVVNEKLNDRSIRPLTDQVQVLSPIQTEYDIDFKYWISQSDAALANTIRSKVELAVEEFIKWTKSKLGRDLLPLELQYRLRIAGAKRIKMTSPMFIATVDHSVAIPRNINIIFEGIEAD